MSVLKINVQCCDHSGSFIFSGSSSFLQVMRTCIKAWISSNFGQIPPLTTGLAALEHLKNICLLLSWVAIDRNLFKLAGNEDIHYILDE